MASSTTTQIARPARGIPHEALVAAGVAATLAAALAWLGPPGSDFAAHLYQSGLFEDHGFAIWNNFWYAGRYSFVTYSLLYYPLAALLGIKLLAVASIATAALAFGVVASREWGPASRWSNRSFAVVWAGVVLSGAFPFALGIALALLALWALQAGRRGRFALLTVLVLTASPVAFVLLAVILAGIGLSRAPRRSELVLPLTTLGLAAAVELVLLRLFPAGGRFPFSLPEFAAACVFCGLGIVLTWRVAAAGVLRWMYVVYLVACTAAYLVPSSLGENIARLRYAAIPIAILTLSLRRWRPLPVALFALTLAVAWNLTPLAGSFVKTSADPAANAAYWAPAVGFLREQPLPLVPRRGGRHRRALARRLPPGRRHPDRARLVPAGRLPAQRPALREARPRAVRRLAPIARGALRRAARCAARLQRQGGGRADRGRDIQPRAGVPFGAHDDLRRAVTAAHRDRAGPRRSAPVRAAQDHRLDRAPRPLPHRDELVAVLDDGRRLPLARRRRHGSPHDQAGRDRAARPVGQRAGCSCGSGRRLEASVRSLSGSAEWISERSDRVSAQAVSARHPSAP